MCIPRGPLSSLFSIRGPARSAMDGAVMEGSPYVSFRAAGCRLTGVHMDTAPGSKVISLRTFPLVVSGIAVCNIL